MYITQSGSGNKTPTMVGIFSFANLLIVEEKLEKLGPQYVSLSVKLRKDKKKIPASFDLRNHALTHVLL